MILKRRQALWLLRHFNRFRRRLRLRYQRFCQSHPYCVICNFRQRAYNKMLVMRDWFKKKVKRGRENVLMTNAHYVLWMMTAAWLIVLGIHLINTNFQFISADRVFASLRGRHQFVDFFIQHVWALVVFIVAAFARDILHEVCRVPEDSVRASRLIKRWLFFFGMFWVFCRGVTHADPVVPPAVWETTITLFVLQCLKWGIRKIRTTFDLPVGSVQSPKVKKAEKFLYVVVKYFLRSRMR